MKKVNGFAVQLNLVEMRIYVFTPSKTKVVFPTRCCCQQCITFDCFWRCWHDTFNQNVHYLTSNYDFTVRTYHTQLLIPKLCIDTIVIQILEQSSWLCLFSVLDQTATGKCVSTYETFFSFEKKKHKPVANTTFYDVVVNVYKISSFLPLG